MKRILFAVLTAFAFAISSAFAAPPELLELRVICMTPAVEQFVGARTHWVNPAVGWYASKEVRKQTPGFQYAGAGFKATILIQGTKKELNLDGVKFSVLTKDNMPTGYVVEGKGGVAQVALNNVDMGVDGAISVTLGRIIDEAKDTPLTITVWPKGWKGTGPTWNEKDGYFKADYSYRKDNQSVLPAMFAVCAK
jgi:hypothetical protein